MLKTYKYRLYPNKKQSLLLDKHIDCVRFVYNLALETKQTSYIGYGINLTSFQLMKQLTDLKSEFTWLKEVNAQSLQQSITNLETAYSRFFKGISKFPKFKKKNSDSGFTAKQDVFIKGNLLCMPKFSKGIKAVIHRELKGVIKSATIKKTKTGKYYAYILHDDLEEKSKLKDINSDKCVGLDLGIKSFLVLSNGTVFENPRYLKKSLERLKYLQRKYSLNNSNKYKKKISLLHEKITNQRKDFLNKTSKYIINNHDSICIEDLSVKNMLKNHKLALHIFDASWSSFVNMLEYKADWYGCNVIKIGRFEPSSKTCSVCGYVNKNLKLSDRHWECPSCFTTLDRDINASINIKKIGLVKHMSGTDIKNYIELPTLVGMSTCKATIT